MLIGPFECVLAASDCFVGAVSGGHWYCEIFLRLIIRLLLSSLWIVSGSVATVGRSSPLEVCTKDTLHCHYVHEVCPVVLKQTKSMNGIYRFYRFIDFQRILG